MYTFQLHIPSACLDSYHCSRCLFRRASGRNTAVEHVAFACLQLRRKRHSPQKTRRSHRDEHCLIWILGLGTTLTACLTGAMTSSHRVAWRLVWLSGQNSRQHSVNYRLPPYSIIALRHKVSSHWPCVKTILIPTEELSKMISISKFSPGFLVSSQWLENTSIPPTQSSRLHVSRVRRAQQSRITLRH